MFWQKKIECRNCTDTEDLVHLCQRHYTKRRQDDTNNGYTQGIEEGRKQAIKSGQVNFSDDLIKQLLQLCHPDKHGNSSLSNEVTKWLLSQRKQRSLK